MKDEPKTTDPTTTHAESKLSASACSLEIEIVEEKRRYVTIELPKDKANEFCGWVMKYNPTHEETEKAIALVKAATPTKEEVMLDSFEIGSVDVS